MTMPSAGLMRSKSVTDVGEGYAVAGDLIKRQIGKVRREEIVLAPDLHAVPGEEDERYVGSGRFCFEFRQARLENGSVGV